MTLPLTFQSLDAALAAAGLSAQHVISTRRQKTDGRVNVFLSEDCATDAMRAKLVAAWGPVHEFGAAPAPIKRIARWNYGGFIITLTGWPPEGA